MQKAPIHALMHSVLARALVSPLGFALLLASPLNAQTAISAAGLVESTSGGFKFPDGSIQTTAAAPFSAPVEDTGQDTCWDTTGTETSCTGTGQDGELQAGVTWPTPRFMDNGDGTVTDNLTGLIWLEMADCFGARTWTDALSDANGLMAGQCGLNDGSVATDWRLPNIKELLSLVDYSESNPALPSAHPFSNVQAAFYWTSSSNAQSPSSAWFVDIETGIGSTDVKSSTNHVWPVRGGE